MECIFFFQITLSAESITYPLNKARWYSTAVINVKNSAEFEFSLTYCLCQTIRGRKRSKPSVFRIPASSRKHTTILDKTQNVQYFPFTVFCIFVLEMKLILIRIIEVCNCSRLNFACFVIKTS